MLISERLNAALNAQVGHELGNSNQYLAVAAYFEGECLFGLAKIYLRQKNYSAALTALDAAERLAPHDYNIHAVRGQALQQSGQREKAAAEFAVYTRMLNAAREKREKEMSGEVLNPELMSTPD